MSESIVDLDEEKLSIPDYARLEVRNVPEQSVRDTGHERYLAAKTGTLKALMIRIIDNRNVAPPDSHYQLKADLFDNDLSLKTQMKACSYGKLQIEPFEGRSPTNRNINNGIVDIKIDFDIRNGEKGFETVARRTAEQQLGSFSDSRWDLIMFCYPQDSVSFLAAALPNSKFSFFNGDACGRIAALMHEVGHNIGLAHSGEAGGDDFDLEYGDTTGMMGSSVEGKLCYNPQKSYQLGWYSDKTTTFDPLTITDGMREFDLNGVADYQKENDAFVVLRMPQKNRGEDFYVGFNRADGITKDTPEDPNMVTILLKEPGPPDAYGKSIKVKSLMPGQWYTISNFDGDRDITVYFAGLNDGNARIRVIDASNYEFPPSLPDKCKKFTIELRTDDYPDDTSWDVIDNGGWGEAPFDAMSDTYTEQWKKYVKEICLPTGTEAKFFKFTIHDKFGDGLRGEGYYKAYDDTGATIFSGGEEAFTTKDHFIIVPKEEIPVPRSPPPTATPTKAPTMNPTASATTPTASAVSCETYSVEVRTDQYPEDNSWKIVRKHSDGKETVVSEVTKYHSIDRIHKTSVCLTTGASFEFKFTDAYSDGICCGRGNGYYRVMDSSGRLVFGSGEKDENFTVKNHYFEVDGPHGGSSSLPPCKDKVKGKFRTKENKGFKKKCKYYAKRNKCNKKIYTGEFIWELCQKTCNRCDDADYTSVQESDDDALFADDEGYNTGADDYIGDDYSGFIGNYDDDDAMYDDDDDDDHAEDDDYMGDDYHGYEYNGYVAIKGNHDLVGSSVDDFEEVLLSV